MTFDSPNFLRRNHLYPTACHDILSVDYTCDVVSYFGSFHPQDYFCTFEIPFKRKSYYHLRALTSLSKTCKRHVSFTR